MNSTTTTTTNNYHHNSNPHHQNQQQYHYSNHHHYPQPVGIAALSSTSSSGNILLPSSSTAPLLVNHHHPSSHNNNYSSSVYHPQTRAGAALSSVIPSSLPAQQHSMIPTISSNHHLSSQQQQQQPNHQHPSSFIIPTSSSYPTNSQSAQPNPPQTTSNSTSSQPQHSPSVSQQPHSNFNNSNSNNNMSNNSAEPKLRVYNSLLKTPEGIFTMDSASLTCEPHGFKPNDRRGAPQTTHSVYVSDVLVVSCDLVSGNHQPGIFQNCTARLVHLLGNGGSTSTSNKRKKKKDGGGDNENDDTNADDLASEDDQNDDTQKKKPKKKNKKKDQDDVSEDFQATDFTQAGMLESFELLSEQPCQENMPKSKIIASLKVPRVRGRDCKTKTGQVQVIRFKGNPEMEQIIAVSDLFWIRSRTRTEMEVRKFKKQSASSSNMHDSNSQQPPQPVSLNWPNVKPAASPSNDSSPNNTSEQLPPKKRRGNGSPVNVPTVATTTSNSISKEIPSPYRVGNFPSSHPNMYHAHHSNNAVTAGHPSHFPISNVLNNTTAHYMPSHHPSHHMTTTASEHVASSAHSYRNEQHQQGQYEELKQRVQFLEEKVHELEQIILRYGMSKQSPSYQQSTSPSMTLQVPSQTHHSAQSTSTTAQHQTQLPPHTLHEMLHTSPNVDRLFFSTPKTSSGSSSVASVGEPATASTTTPNNPSSIVFKPFPIDMFSQDIPKVQADSKKETPSLPSIPSIIQNVESQNSTPSVFKIFDSSDPIFPISNTPFLGKDPNNFSSPNILQSFSQPKEEEQK